MTEPLEEERPYNRPVFSGPKSESELLEEADTAKSHVLYFDKKFERSREILVFIEETKIWQDLLQDCLDRAGVAARTACRQLSEIVQERNVYYNAKFNAALRPKLTPGLPPVYERVIRE